MVAVTCNVGVNRLKFFFRVDARMFERLDV